LFTVRRNYLGIGIVAAVGLFSITWTALTGTLSGQAEVNDAPLVGGSFFDGVVAMVHLTPGYLQQAAGVFGWLDTPLPTFVYALYAGAISVLLTLALVVASRHDRVVIVSAVVVAAVTPVVVQSLSVARTGIIWQGRYGLFLYLSVFVIAAWALARSGPWVDRLRNGVTAVVVTMLAVFQVASYFVVLHRYVVGGSGTLNSMVSHPAWQPPGGWELLTIVMGFIAAAFAVWIWLLSGRLQPSGAARLARSAHD
jgi:hypothetical protein